MGERNDAEVGVAMIGYEKSPGLSKGGMSTRYAVLCEVFVVYARAY